MNPNRIILARAETLRWAVEIAEKHGMDAGTALPLIADVLDHAETLIGAAETEHGLAVEAAEIARAVPSVECQPKQRQPHPRRGQPFEPVWSDERRALLTDRYGNGAPLLETLEAINALPGPKVTSINAMKQQANKMGVLRPGPVVTFPSDEETTECLAMLRTGTAVREVAAWFGWPPERVLAIRDAMKQVAA